MSELPFEFRFSRVYPPAKVEYVQDRPLHRVMRFTGRSIDDIVNSRIAKNEVLGYFKLQKFVNRRMEILDLEKQWNPLG